MALPTPKGKRMLTAQAKDLGRPHLGFVAMLFLLSSIPAGDRMEHWLGLLQNGRRSSSLSGSLSPLPQLGSPNTVLWGCSLLSLGPALGLLFSLTVCPSAVFLWPLVAGLGWDWSPSASGS